MPEMNVHSPSESVARLREGNARFVANTLRHPSISLADRKAVLDGQTPFATIVSCSDSRVPPEIIFDCGIGDLFVIRSAGNILDKAGLGSMLYAVTHLKCPLVVVMGHESCGAVTAALKSDDAIASEPPIIRDLIYSVQTQIPHALATRNCGDICLRAAIEENVETTVETLRRMDILENNINSGTLEIITGYYSLTKGTVTFGYNRS